MFVKFGLTLALMVLASQAQATAKFWNATCTGGGDSGNCTNGTDPWDADSGTGGAAHKCWSSQSTPGGTCQAVPTTADDVTFDANSGSGTIIVGTSPAASSITCGAYGGGLDFSVNNPSMSFNSNTGLNCSGAGTRNIKLGSGTFTFTPIAGAVNFGTTTGLTLSAAAATFVFNASACQNNFTGGGLAYGTVTYNCSGTSASNATISNAGGTITTLNYQPTGYNPISLSGAQTITNFNIAPTGTGAAIFLTVAQTFTVGTITTTTSAANPIAILSGNSNAANPTLSAATNQNLNWAAVVAVTFAGAGTWTATNSTVTTKSSGITSVPPSGGGGGGIIGG
jgi:hypothetical protein